VGIYPPHELLLVGRALDDPSTGCYLRGVWLQFEIYPAHTLYPVHHPSLSKDYLNNAFWKLENISYKFQRPQRNAACSQTFWKQPRVAVYRFAGVHFPESDEMERIYRRLNSFDPYPRRR
jgi:hypothetical protein